MNPNPNLNPNPDPNPRPNPSPNPNPNSDPGGGGKARHERDWPLRWEAGHVWQQAVPLIARGIGAHHEVEDSGRLAPHKHRTAPRAARAARRAPPRRL